MDESKGTCIKLVQISFPKQVSQIIIVSNISNTKENKHGYWIILNKIGIGELWTLIDTEIKQSHIEFKTNWKNPKIRGELLNRINQNRTK